MIKAGSLETIRVWASQYIQTITFLGAYFLLIVLGNLIFASPWGEQSLLSTDYKADLLSFEYSFSSGYWALLLSPFAVTPVLVPLTRKLAEKPVEMIVSLLPDFRKVDFAVLFAICLAFVIYQFWKADVLAIFASGTNATASVEARFEIRERIGFQTFVPLQSLMTFLTFFAIVRALRENSYAWWVITVGSALIVSILLTMVDMKWPVLLFFLGLVAAVFMFSRQYAYVKTVIGLALVVVCYIAISMFVFRIAPTVEPPAVPKIIQQSQQPQKPQLSQKPRQKAEPQKQQLAAPDIVPGVKESTAGSEILRYAVSALGFARTLVPYALNRMAISYPYYYQIFTERGAVCGGVLEQAMPDPKCRPSTYIYRLIFGRDGFEGRGTSPMPVHVSGYAYGGWPIAMVGLAIASVILGLFAAIPLEKSAMAGAFAVTGAVTGYHFSQIPGEGVVFYDHGLFWLALMLLAYAIFRMFGIKRRSSVLRGANQ